jgi:hypothetical protein
MLYVAAAWRGSPVRITLLGRLEWHALTGASPSLRQANSGGPTGQGTATGAQNRTYNWKEKVRRPPAHCAARVARALQLHLRLPRLQVLRCCPSNTGSAAPLPLPRSSHPQVNFALSVNEMGNILAGDYTETNPLTMWHDPSKLGKDEVRQRTPARPAPCCVRLRRSYVRAVVLGYGQGPRGRQRVWGGGATPEMLLRRCPSAQPKKKLVLKRLPDGATSFSLNFGPQNMSVAVRLRRAPWLGTAGPHLMRVLACALSRSSRRNSPRMPMLYARLPPRLQVSKGEFEVFRSIASYAIPRLLGFDRVLN